MMTVQWVRVKVVQYKERATVVDVTVSMGYAGGVEDGNNVGNVGNMDVQEVDVARKVLVRRRALRQVAVEAGNLLMEGGILCDCTSRRLAAQNPLDRILCTAVHSVGPRMEVPRDGTSK